MNKNTHKTVLRSLNLSDLEGPIKNTQEHLEKIAEGLENPRLSLVYGYDYVEALIVGEVPLTPKEIAQNLKRREKNRKLYKALKEKRLATAAKKLFKLADQLGYSLKEK